MDKWVSLVRDSAYVDRFHNTVIHRPYNVGFHTYNVTVICDYLVEMNNIPSKQSHMLLVASLYHDSHELYTGDIPANFKWENSDVVCSLEVAERKWEDENLPSHALTARDAVNSDRDLSYILKQADLLELGFFIRDEIDLGNKRLQQKLELVLDTSVQLQQQNELRGVYEIADYLRGQYNE